MSIRNNFITIIIHFNQLPMRTQQNASICILQSVSKLFGVFVLLCLISFPAYSQESGSTKPASSEGNLVYPTFGIGIGFFYPQEVNDYIQEDLLASYYTVNADIYMYLEIKGGITYRLKNIDFNALLEYDMAPKFVTVTNGSDNLSFSYNRLSPEISTNFYIPGKSGRNAFFIGAGVNYSFLKFKEFSASAPGFKVQLGYSMQFKNINMQPYGAFRYTKATDSEARWGVMDEHEGITLDYIGGQIGVIFSFHKKKSYR